MSDKGKKEDSQCVLYEIEQFICDYDEKKDAGRVQCFPVPRIFRQCPNRPVVEVTALARVSAKTGELEFPNGLDALPKGKAWRDTIKQPTEESESTKVKTTEAPDSMIDDL